jgi:ER lumen protein retaining receptor
MAELKPGYAANRMNIFRVLGDVSHTLSKCILIWAIHSNKSAEGKPQNSASPDTANEYIPGVSLITQVLYTAVFVTRYLDLFTDKPSFSYWNFVLKNFYILSSIYIVILMTRIYARTREKEKAWKLGGFSLGGSLVAAPFIALIFRKFLPRWEHHKIMVVRSPHS